MSTIRKEKVMKEIESVRDIYAGAYADLLERSRKTLRECIEEGDRSKHYIEYVRSEIEKYETLLDTVNNMSRKLAEKLNL